MRPEVAILVVEDDLLDAKNIKRSFSESNVRNPLFFVRNGEEALAYLRREPPFDDPAAAPRPGVILLDLHMPRMDGLAFLREYKADAALQNIPAVVLTTSDNPSDQHESYECGAAGYIVKPVVFQEFVNAIKRFNQYWSLCEVPSDE